MPKNRNGFAPVPTSTFSGATSTPRVVDEVLGGRLAQLRDPRGRAVVRLARPQRLGCDVTDVERRREVRLADLEVDDVVTLALERLRSREDAERRLGAEALQALGHAPSGGRAHGSEPRCLIGNWRTVEGGHDQAGRRTYASRRLEAWPMRAGGDPAPWHGRPAARGNSRSSIELVVSASPVASSQTSLRVVCLPGDGIGPEVMAVAQRVLRELAPDLELEEHLFGGRGHPGDGDVASRGDARRLS